MIRVTCAVIRNEENQVLVVQRGETTDHPLKWEFPGGKIDDGESEEECIIREVREELSMDIVICSRLANVSHDYGIKNILLIPFVCDTLDELPMLSEHVAFRWIGSDELMKVDFSEADIPVAAGYVEKYGFPAASEGSDLPEGSDNVSDDELRDMIVATMGIRHDGWVAKSATENPAIFRKLLEFSFSDDKKLAFHASWILSKACDTFPGLITPFLPGIIEKLDKIDNESAQRSFLRILSLTPLEPLSEKHHGILAEHSFTSLRSGFTAIAIKAYSMEILYKLALIYPELANELSATIIMIEPEGSAGMKARGKMILRKLAGSTNDKRRGFLS
jgi:8-oxo-dGTP diphosphatase